MVRHRAGRQARPRRLEVFVNWATPRARATAAAGTRRRPATATRAGRAAKPAAARRARRAVAERVRTARAGTVRRATSPAATRRAAGRGRASDSEAKKDQDGDQKGGGPDRESEEAKERRWRTRQGGSDSQSNPQLGGALEKIAGVVKWIVFAIVAVLVVFGLFFGVLKYLAPFTDWAQRLARRHPRVVGEPVRQGEPGASATGGRPERAARRRCARRRSPSYSNPFADGSAEDARPGGAGRVHVRGARRVGLGPRRGPRPGRDAAGVRAAAGRRVSRTSRRCSRSSRTSTPARRTRRSRCRHTRGPHWKKCGSRWFTAERWRSERGARRPTLRSDPAQSLLHSPTSCQ